MNILIDIVIEFAKIVLLQDVKTNVIGRPTRAGQGLRCRQAAFSGAVFDCGPSAFCLKWLRIF